MATNTTTSELQRYKVVVDNKAKSIGHYLLGKEIGEGTFGKVRLGTHILTGEKVAIKVLEKSKIKDSSDIERVAREIHILKIIRHPNIIQLYEIIETTNQLYLITEYVSGGEVFDYIVANKRVKEKEACKFFQQIISGIEYLHRINVVHRDLKPENLLLDNNKNIKIVDFGLSNTYKSGEKLKTACGSPCYAAPEMIAGKKYVGLQVDIWSAGVVLYALVCGYLPFEDPNTAVLYQKIMAGSYSLPKFLSSEARDLLRGILNTDPARRFTLDDIRRHPWYSLAHCCERPGIVVGTQKIFVDSTVVRQLPLYGFDPDYAVKCIEANKHNHVTTTYYLLLLKKSKTAGGIGGDSGADANETAVRSKREETDRNDITALKFAVREPVGRPPVNPRRETERKENEVPRKLSPKPPPVPRNPELTLNPRLSFNSHAERLSADMEQDRGGSRRSSHYPAFVPVGRVSPALATYIKDRLNITIGGNEVSSHRPYAVNNRFGKVKRTSINGPAKQSKQCELARLLSGNRATPLAGDTLFNNSHITFIRPQINNVTIIANPNGPKARTTISRYMRDKCRNKTRPASIDNTHANISLDTVVPHLKNNRDKDALSSTISNGVTNREQLNKSVDIGKQYRTLESRTYGLYNIPGSKTPSLRPVTLRLQRRKQRPIFSARR